MLRALIAHGADVKATLPNNPEGRTALHTAATRNDVAAIDGLVDAGGDVEARDRGGDTPLHCAALNSSLEASMTFLMHGADVNAQTRQRETPLHWVAEAAGEEEALEVVNFRGRSPRGATFKRATRHLSLLSLAMHVLGSGCTLPESSRNSAQRSVS